MIRIRQTISFVPRGIPDADGHRVLTFTDWRGRTVLVRKVLGDSKYIDTHTLYDAWGDVLLVLQPEGVAAMQAAGSWDVSDGSMDDVIEKYAYVYRYDDALRPVYVKLPGVDPVTTAYDPDGLAAYTVDGNLRAKGRARFTLYDSASRPVVTGICKEPTGEVPRMRASFGSSDPGLDSTYYSTGVPLSGAEVYTATYYDGYGFVSLPPFAAIPAVQLPTVTAAAGLVTATLDRVLDGTLDPGRAKYVATVNTYDAEARPIKTVTAYHDTGICAVSENSYNIDGTVSTCTITLLHPYDGHNDSHTYAYDSAGRLVGETVSYDGGDPVAVQQLSYNAVGQLASNDLGAFSEAYTYNVRGAMTKRKSDVFEQTISFSNHFDRLYNGSIGMITDKLTGGKSTTSGYSYDNAGRLTSAMIFLDGKMRPTGYTYDLNGNITTLQRRGYNPTYVAELIDDLAYHYDGNQVRKITEKAPVVISEKTMNFIDGADEDVEYTYDRNGNMTSDANRGIAMFWDYNNRLEKVNFGFDKYLSFTRSATGRKLSMTNRTPAQRPSIGLGRPWIATTTVRHYYGAYEYAGGRFSRLNTTTGYRDSVGTHVYVRDWQDNIRAVVRKGADGKTILEQATYYYPYGMPMAESTNPTANRYKYIGKELLTDHGVNILDYGPRPYDPTTGIWWSVDALSHKTPDYSHYVFCNADPINHIDPTGYAAVYNRLGLYLGCSSEGFEGDIFIYSGSEEMNFSDYTQDDLKKMCDENQNGLSYLDDERGQGTLSNEAYSSIWTHIFNYFEGTTTNGVTFNPSSLPDNHIYFQHYGNDNFHGAWGTCTTENNIFKKFIGSNAYSYESTIENIASSLIAHEWLSHYVNDYGDNNNNHSLAYKNTMQSIFWEKTTDEYKKFTRITYFTYLLKEYIRTNNYIFLR